MGGVGGVESKFFRFKELKVVKLMESIKLFSFICKFCLRVWLEVWFFIFCCCFVIWFFKLVLIFFIFDFRVVGFLDIFCKFLSLFIWCLILVSCFWLRGLLFVWLEVKSCFFFWICCFNVFGFWDRVLNCFRVFFICFCFWLIWVFSWVNFVVLIWFILVKCMGINNKKINFKAIVKI